VPAVTSADNNYSHVIASIYQAIFFKLLSVPYSEIAWYQSVATVIPGRSDPVVESLRRFGYNARPVYPATAE
jgi:hypothetical protein